MPNKVWLGVEEDSQFAKVLKRIAENPAVTTQQVCEMITQRARTGAQVPITPTRGSFLLDLLADATEGNQRARRVGKGKILIRGVKDSLRTETPGEPVQAGEKTVEFVAADKVRINIPNVEVVREEPKAEPKNGPVEIKGSVEVTPGGRDKIGEVEVVFPEAPPLPEAKRNWRKPDWHDDMAAALDHVDENTGRHKHVALVGPPGIGKSTAAEQYFIAKQQPFVTINSDAGLRRRDLVGSIELANGSTRFVCAEYAAAMIFGWGVIINEVNAADADALLFLNGQLEAPFTVNIHGRSYPVHKDSRVVVTYNYGVLGTKLLPPAFKDRFFTVKVDFPNPDTLEKILNANGMPLFWNYKTMLLQFAAKANELCATGATRYQITPRRLFDVIFLVEKRRLSYKVAVQKAVLDGIDNPQDRKPLAEFVERQVLI